MKTVTQSHIDFAWQNPSTEEEVLLDLECELERAIPRAGGFKVGEVEATEKYSHQKMRVTIIVELVENFK